MQNYATHDIVSKLSFFHSQVVLKFLSLLYIQCLPHSWYLGVDMQLYIISPLFLIALFKWGKKAAYAIVMLVVLVTVWLFTLIMTKNYSMFLL